MKLVALMLASTLSLANYQPTWTFERQGLAAVLTEPDIAEVPLRLACGERGFLEIRILAGAKSEVTLVGPTKIALTIRGDTSSDGRVVSQVYFRSMTVEFLRQEGDVEVAGSKPYRLHLNGARRVLETLESSCLAVS
jgi:hypothetical protein